LPESLQLGVTRRALLRTLLLIASVAALVLSTWRLGLRVLIGRVLEPRLDTSSPTGALSDLELDTVVAFAEALVEGRTLSPAERGYLIGHVRDRALRTPGYAALYRTTARVLDRLAAAPFSTLGLGDRAAVMVRHRLTESAVAPIEHLWPLHRETLTVRMLAAPDLVAGYYRSPAGWAAVGYAAFPGRCGDLSRYTKPEAAA
jgi:hypothetical protein